MANQGLTTNGRRVILLIVYVAVSMALSFMFGISSSGPLQALFILTGWTFILSGLLHLTSWPAFVVELVLYLVALLFLNNRIAPRLRSRLPFVPLSIHCIGAALCFSVPGRDELDAGFFVNALAWIIPLAVVLSYFLLEWRLALRAKGARGMVNNNGLPQVK